MKTSYYSLFFLLFILSGCAATYLQAPKNMPLFETKGEVQIEAGVSTTSYFATGSYAFSEKYALIANGSLSYGNFWDDIPDALTIVTFGFAGSNVLPHHSVEMGLGRYNLLPSSKWKLETFLGAQYSMGNYHNDYDRCLQGFTQVNIGRRYNYIETGWSLSLAYSDFQLKTLSSNTQNIKYDNANAIIAEPLVFLKLGGKQIQLFCRCGFCFLYILNSSVEISSNFYFNAHCSTGLSFRF